MTTECLSESELYFDWQHDTEHSIRIILYVEHFRSVNHRLDHFRLIEIAVISIGRRFWTHVTCIRYHWNTSKINSDTLGRSKLDLCNRTWLQHFYTIKCVRTLDKVSHSYACKPSMKYHSVMCQSCKTFALKHIKLQHLVLISYKKLNPVTFQILHFF